MSDASTLTVGAAGKDALWLGFIGMFVPTIFFAIATMKEPAGKKYFHVVTTMITAIASLAYLTMAAGYGSIIRDDGRQFFYARYIDWAMFPHEPKPPKEKYKRPMTLDDLKGLKQSRVQRILKRVEDRVEGSSKRSKAREPPRSPQISLPGSPEMKRGKLSLAGASRKNLTDF